MTIDTVTQFCVCSEEMCFCANTIEMGLDDAAAGAEWQCSECTAGNHAWSPDSPRGESHGPQERQAPGGTTASS